MNLLFEKGAKKKIYLFVAMIGFLFTILWFTPIVWILLTSIKPTGEILTSPPQWIPSEFTLMHYNRVLEKPVGQWTLNSLFISIISTISTLLLGAMAGYAFARLQFFVLDCACFFYDAFRGYAYSIV